LEDEEIQSVMTEKSNDTAKEKLKFTFKSNDE
jgi:hypothetical protein